MKKITTIQTILLMFISVALFGQAGNQDVEKGNLLMDYPLNDEAHPCISDAQYQEMDAEITKNVKRLGLDKLENKTNTLTNLAWPLRQTTGFNDCGYYYISAFVDMDATSAVKDWNCGARSYNGHRGIDIVSWPFIWDKMDHNATEVIAAAPGTIVAKVDGNPDRVCNGVGGGSTSNNYITIQHADGSQALYVHIKTGSFTSKVVGQTVAVGEFLGNPGSAGQSSGQHLHFEVRSLGTFASYIDPNFGPCNPGVTASWWANQKPYVEPELMKLSTHSSWPYYGVCPITVDTVYAADTFVSSPGAQATFHAATKHVAVNDSWSFRILNPNNTVFDSWTFTSLSARTTSTLGWNRALPTAPGIYTFEGTFNGLTCSHTFEITSPISVKEESVKSKFKIYPNPNEGKFNFSTDEELMIGKNLSLQIINTMGQTIKEVTITEKNIEVEFTLSSGLYFYKVINGNTALNSGKIVVK